jgi:hypothetical protein
MVKDDTCIFGADPEKDTHALIFEIIFSFSANLSGFHITPSTL